MRAKMTSAKVDRSPCLTRIAVGNVDGQRWAVAADGSVACCVAWMDPNVKPSGWEGLLGAAPDPSAFLATAIKAAVSPVSSEALRQFATEPCELCSDARGHDCAPRDECDGDGWAPCRCVMDVKRGKIGRKHYDRRLIGIVLRSLPADVGSYSIGQFPRPTGKHWALVIHAGEQMGIVMEILTEPEHIKGSGPFPTFSARGAR